ncbi:hypothetical protein DM02DRAFT_676840 [Periconia macrospinosa]|uniref:SnoaL-like domain-containing protein n=1 Tax=Periconia macrospinosa TaxID=97972 RepID=A0A2V1D5Z1_9PLEO|nr:hypothetical protein DM02DRAFT_676840 [Periconia macrospinosa]
MPIPAKITGLSPREEVADALYRCLQGLDSNNRDLFETSMLKTEDFRFISTMFTIEGWTALTTRFEIVFNLITTHITSNVRVELTGPDTASLTCQAVSYHVRPEDQFKVQECSFTGYNLYDIDLVKDEADGLWKIKTWNIDVRRTTGDAAIVQG